MSRRSEQVSAELRRKLAAALLEVASSEQLLTLTRVKVTDDLRHADIAIAGWKNIDSKDQSHIRHELALAAANASTMKFTPRLHIVDDDSSEYAAHISQLLQGDVDPSDESA